MTKNIRETTIKEDFLKKVEEELDESEITIPDRDGYLEDMGVVADWFLKRFEEEINVILEEHMPNEIGSPLYKDLDTLKDRLGMLK